MSVLIIVGAQWGDEAKGKLVDVLAEESDFVVRYSGGNNAGHTVLVDGEEFRFHLLPAGILHPRITAVLGGGMVVCPKSLLEELYDVETRRPAIGKLRISKAAHVVFPYHLVLDRCEETARGTSPIGTTSRGIGPAYQDKVARFGIRMSEFVNPPVFQARLAEVLRYKNRLLQMFGQEPIEFASLYEEYARYADRLRDNVADADVEVRQAVAEGKRVLFEGAQGTFLDLDSGSYPYVTSSHPVAGGACLGTGIGPRDVDAVIGVCKAYTTRVGSGPFPTELLDEVGEQIRAKGKEYGTTTGRGRRCGWLDLVLLRQSVAVNSMSGIALTRLDILGGLDKILVAEEYSLDGRRISHVPQDTESLARAVPVYRELTGWTEDISNARSLADLPSAALAYVRHIESATGIPVVMLSVGPERSQTIRLEPDLWRAKDIRATSER